MCDQKTLNRFESQMIYLVKVVMFLQRPALIPYHSMELRLIDGEGGWELRSIKQN
jgi:hypothetical protein